MFVKFGQIASTRTDLLPETITDELSNLHADVERVPPDELEKVLEAELGEPVDQAFDEFEVEPLAAASIGQTHRAKLHGGHPVVVKVQRPGMEEIVQRDGSVLSLVARTLERRVEAARRIGARELADELIESIEAELDFQREASGGDPPAREPGGRRRGRDPRRAPNADHPAGAGDGGGRRPAAHRCGRGRRGAGRARRARPPPAELVPRSDPPGRLLPRRPASRQHPARRRGHALALGLRLGRSPRSGDARVPAGDRDRVLDPRRLADRARRPTPGRRQHQRHARARARHGVAARGGSGRRLQPRRDDRRARRDGAPRAAAAARRCCCSPAP